MIVNTYKRIIRFLFVLILWTGFAYGTVSVSPGSKVVSETSTSTTFTITADEAWTVTKNPADTWIESIYPTSGNETAIVTIGFTRNAHSSDARSSVLSITGGNSFILTQEGDTEGPQAIAGDDFAAANTANLDGSASTDNIGIEYYAWSKVSGPGSVVFGDATAAATTVWASQEGDYTLQLTVTDSAGMSNSDQVVMTWDQTPPLINSVSFSPTSGWRKVGESITLNINASDDTDLFINSVQINGENVTAGTASAVVYTIEEGDTDIGENEQIPVSIILEDAAGNTNVAYTTSPSADQSPAIDANKPVITGVSFVPASGYHKIGDAITLRITSTETDLLRNQIQVNNRNVTNMTDEGGGIYTAVYTVIEGHDDVAEDEQIPISVKLSDQAGNLSDTFTSSPLPNVTPAIDANKPVITSVVFSPTSGWHKIGDSFTMTLSAGEPDLTENVITVNGAAVTNFTDNLDNTYTVTYTVVEGHTTIVESQQIPISVRLTDIAGNESAAFTTSPAANVSPAIDGSKPVVSSVAFSPSTGLLKVGELIRLNIQAGESGLITQEITINGQVADLVTDNGDASYTAEYTISEGDDDIDEDETVPVRVIFRDAAGNTNDAYTTSPAYTQCPGIDGHSPVITAVSFSPNSGILPIGDVIEMTFQTGESGLSAAAILVNNMDVTSTLQDNNDGSYTVQYTIVDGHTDRSPTQQIPISITMQDDAGNQNAAYTTPPSASLSPAIDANKPLIIGVSFDPSSGWRKIGENITLTISAGETGLNDKTITVNGKAVTGFTDLGDGSYRVNYTVASGDTDIGDAERIPVSVVLIDDAGNENSPYTVSPVAGSCPAIDAHVPVISNLAFSPASGWRKIGDSVTISLNTGESGLTLNSGTVNGKSVTGFTDNLDGTYSAIYTVVEGDNDIAGSSQIPVNFILADAAGNQNTAYTTSPNASVSPAIDGHKPSISSLTYQPSSGWHKIGESFTLTVDANESGLTATTFTLNSKNVISSFTDLENGTYSVTYTVSAGDQNIGESDQIPVNIVLQDAAGNANDAYTLAAPATSTPAIDAGAPVVTTVSFSPTSGWRKIGETVTMTIQAGESGLNEGTITVNGEGVSGFTDRGDGSYTVIYTVASGHTDIAESERIPVSVTLMDEAGNESTTYTVSPLAGDCPAIDANAPVITGVSFEPASGYHTIGETITLLINGNESGLTAGTIQVNSKSVTGFTDLGTGWYSAVYTVAEGDADVAEDEEIPLSVTLKDAAGNESAVFSDSPAASVSPAVDAQKPVITGVSFSPASGWLKIGETITMTILAAETNLQPVSISVNDHHATEFTDLGDGTYTVLYTVASGHTDIAENETIPVSIQLSDAAGNVSSVYTVSPSATVSPAIDANKPAIYSVSYSPASGWRKIGDVVGLTFNAGETGLFEESITVNGKAVSHFTDNLDNTYTVNYTVVEGDTDIGEGDRLPLSIQVRDAVGNLSPVYDTAPDAANCPAVDATRPAISSLTFSPQSGILSIGEILNLTVSAGETGLLENAITVNGNAVTGYTDNLNGTYTVTYTVDEGDPDRGMNDQIPVSIVLADPAGNTNAAYTSAPAPSLTPSVDANRPVLTSVAYSPSSGWRKIGDSVTVTIRAEESDLVLSSLTVNTKSITSGFTDHGNNTYTAVYTVIQGDPDRGENEQIPLQVILADSAGNVSATFNSSPSATACPAIDAHTPAAPLIPVCSAGSYINLEESESFTLEVDFSALSAASGDVLTLYVNAGSLSTHVLDVTDVSAGTYTFTLSGDMIPPDGSKSFTARLTDAAGNAGTLSPVLDVILDREVPQAVISYSDSLVKALEAVTIRVEFSEGMASNPLISVNYTGSDDDILNALLSPIALSDSLFSYALTIPAGSDNDGYATVSVSGTDPAENPVQILSGNQSLLVDNTPPASFAISQVTVTGEDVIHTSTPNIRYYNMSATAVNVTVPVAADVSLINGQTFLEMKLGANPWKTVGDIRTIPHIADQTFIVTDEILARDLNGFSTGDGKTIQIRATLEDIAGNSTTSASAVETIYLDRIPPTAGTVMDSLNVDLDYTRFQTIPVSWKNFSDNHSGIQRYDVRVDSDNLFFLPNAWESAGLDTFKLDLTIDGGYQHGDTYFFSVRAVDTAGNVSDTTISDGIMFDYMAPLSSPVVSDYVYDTHYILHDTLRGTCSDNGAGVKRVRLAIQRESDGFYWNGADWQSAVTRVQGRISDAGNWYYPTLPAQALDDQEMYEIQTTSVDSAGNIQASPGSDTFQYLSQAPPDFVSTQSDTSILEDRALLLTLGADDNNRHTLAPERLTYHLDEGPDGMVFTRQNDTTAVLQWQTDNEDVGTHAVRLLVRDHTELEDTLAFSLTVLPLNDPPFVRLPLPDKSIPEDTQNYILLNRLETYFDDMDATDSLRFSVIFSREDAVDSVHFRAAPGDKSTEGILARLNRQKGTAFLSSKKIEKNDLAKEKSYPGGLLPSSHQTQMIVYLTLDFYGDVDMVITATDDSLETIKDTLRLTVTATNDKPLIATIPDTTLSEDSTLVVRVHLADVEADPLRIRVISDTTAIPDFTAATGLDTGYHDITIPVQEHWFGMAIVQMIVSDRSLSDTSAFQVTLLPVNDPPAPFDILYPPDNQRLTKTWPDTVRFRWTGAVDVDNPVLTYRFLCRTDSLDTLFLTSDTVFSLPVQSLNFPHASEGDVTWSVTAADGEFTTASTDTFTFNLDPPVMNATPDTLTMTYILGVDYDTTFIFRNEGYKPLSWNCLYKPDWLAMEKMDGNILRNARDSITATIRPDQMEYGYLSDSLLIRTNMPDGANVILRFLVEMVTTGKYSIAVVQNAVFHQYFDFILNDSLGMADSVEFFVDDEPVSINAISSYTYTARLHQPAAGSHELKVLSYGYAGMAEIIRHISVVMTKSMSDWNGQSADGKLGVFGKRGTAREDMRLLLVDSTFHAGSSDHILYRLGLSGETFDAPVLLTLKEGRENQALYVKMGDVWQEIPTLYRNNGLKAWTRNMGEYRLGEKTIYVPETTELTGNYPNPFNPSTTLTFDVGFEDGPDQLIRCDIYNIRGQLIRTLIHDRLAIGRYEWRWNGQTDTGKQVSSGVYITRFVSSAGYTKTLKMTLIR